MIAQLAQFANDCYHILRGPGPAKTSVLRNLVFPGNRPMGFQVEHFDRTTVRYLYREIFARQYYHFVASTNSPTILDCGANVGMASIYFKWLYPNSKIKAFEPDPATFGLLQRNLNRNRLDVETYNCALWDENGELDFYVDTSHPGSLLMSTDASRLHVEAIKVKSRKLSDFINGPIDFMKLDVEGAEHRVFNDLIQTGRLKNIRQMAIEYHHSSGQNQPCLAQFLHGLESSGFQYELHASRFPVTSNRGFQDILISANQ
jgi:FkbM family methyltransferase